MKNLKKLSIVTIIVGIMLSLMIGFSITSSAAHQDGFYYEVNRGEAAITDYTDHRTYDVIIPDTLGGYPVTAIDDYAFANSEKITSVKIPDSVSSIGDYSFASCVSLKEITIPANVTSIGECAFIYCTELNNIVVNINNNSYLTDANGVLFNIDKTTLVQYPLGNTRTQYTVPNSVTTIGGGAFAESTLKNIYLSDSIKVIETNAFDGCIFTDITIPDNVEIIKTNAFAYCSNLKEVTLPDSVSYVDFSAFYECDSLKNVTVLNPDCEICDDESTFYSYAKISGYLDSTAYAYAEKYDRYFDEINYLTYESKSGKVTVTGCMATATSVRIPEKYKGDPVVAIAPAAFKNCTNLKRIAFSNSIKTIGENAFEGCTSLEKIFVPNINAWLNIEFKNSYSNPMRYGQYLYIGKDIINVVNIPNGIINIKDYAFYGINSITKVNIPSSVETIGAYAFSWCDSLKSVSIGNNVTKINARAFANCVSLTDVSIGINVKTIGSYAFYGCNSLKNVYYSGTCKQWADIEKGSNNSALNSVKISHSYKNVITKATPTKGGKIENKCSICGNVKSKTTIYYPKTIALSATKYAYNGKAKAPAVTIKDSQGKTLKNGTDYTVIYSAKKTNPGKYAATITFKGNYSGTVTKYYIILPGKTSKVTTSSTATTLKATWNTVTGATGYKVEIINSNGKVVKTLNTRNSYYTFTGLSTASYYKVRVTAYKIISNKAEYSLSSTSASNYTKPSTPTFSVSSTTKGKANFSWSDVNRETGYQVYCSTSQNGTYSKIGTYAADSKSGSKINLTSGKTYYFKVRAYKKVGDTVYYSGWSTIKSIKIK